MNVTSTTRALLLLATLGWGVLPASAQVDEAKEPDSAGSAKAAESAAPASNEVLDEIVAYGKRSGDPTDADPKYEAMWRQQMQDEITRMRVEEEEQWRRGDLTTTTDTTPRMEWGYDPQSDRERRNDLDLNTRSSDTTRPATLFRAQF